MTLSCNLNFRWGFELNDEARKDAKHCRECARAGERKGINFYFTELFNEFSIRKFNLERFGAKLQEVNALLLLLE